MARGRGFIAWTLSAGFPTGLALALNGIRRWRPAPTVRRLVVTLASPRTTLLRLRIRRFSRRRCRAADPILLTTGTGFSPRLGPNYLLYVSAKGTGESIWKFANGTSTELWSGEGAHVLGGPAVSPDGRYFAFSVSQHGQTLLYVMQADGTNSADRGRFAEPARCSGVGARRAIDHFGGGGSRCPAPLSHTDRRRLAHGFCSRIFGRSGVVARRALRCLLGTRRRHDVFREGRYAGSCGASPAILATDPGARHVRLLPGGRVTRCSAGRDSTQESMAY